MYSLDYFVILFLLLFLYNRGSNTSRRDGKRAEEIRQAIRPRPRKGKSSKSWPRSPRNQNQGKYCNYNTLQPEFCFFVIK